MALFDNKKRFLRTPASGVNAGKQAIEDANLAVVDALNIPNGDTNTLNGAQDKDGYIRMTDGIIYSYANGVWTKYATVNGGDFILASPSTPQAAFISLDGSINITGGLETGETINVGGDVFSDGYGYFKRLYLFNSNIGDVGLSIQSNPTEENILYNANISHVFSIDGENKAVLNDTLLSILGGLTVGDKITGSSLFTVTDPKDYVQAGHFENGVGMLDTNKVGLNGDAEWIFPLSVLIKSETEQTSLELNNANASLQFLSTNPLIGTSTVYAVEGETGISLGTVPNDRTFRITNDDIVIHDNVTEKGAKYNAPYAENWVVGDDDLRLVYKKWIEDTTQGIIKVVFEGDSITAPTSQGGFDTNYSFQIQNYNETIAEAKSVNVALGGDTAVNYISSGQFMSQVYPNRPLTDRDTSYFFVFFGTNDLGTGRVPSQLYNDLKTIWTQARANGFRVIAFTILPRLGGLQPLIDETNALIISDTSLYDYLVRTDLVLTDASNLTYFYNDGTHPNAEGSKLIAIEVDKVLRKICSSDITLQSVTERKNTTNKSIIIKSASLAGFQLTNPANDFNYLIYGGTNGSGMSIFNYNTSVDVLSLFGDKVGIKNVNPTQALDVNGNGKFSGLAGTGTRPVAAQADGTLVIDTNTYQIVLPVDAYSHASPPTPTSTGARGSVWYDPSNNDKYEWINDNVVARYLADPSF